MKKIGLALTALILPALGINCGPVGWIVAGVSLTVEAGLLLFESHGDRLAKARARLEKELTDSVNATCDNIWTQLEKNLKRLVTGKVDLVINELTKIETVINSLAETQSTLADNLRTETRAQYDLHGEYRNSGLRRGAGFFLYLEDHHRGEDPRRVHPAR